MMLQIAVIVAAVAATIFFWHRVKVQNQKTLAEFKVESERLHGDRVRRAQEKFDQAELALSKDNNEANQQEYNEALCELNALIPRQGTG